MAKQIADSLVIAEFVPGYSWDFRVMDRSIQGILAAGHYQAWETRSIGLFDIPKPDGLPTECRGAVFSVVPRTSRRAHFYNELRNELARHGYRESTAHELLSFGIEERPYLEETKIRLHALDVNDDRIPFIQVEPNGNLSAGTEFPGKAINDSTNYFLAIEKKSTE